jgi:hypothetical protein
MRGSIPALLVIALSGCAADRGQGLRKPADRTLAHNVCPQPGAAEQAQAGLARRARFLDLISSNETLAFGPTRIIWLHPPDELLNRCR